MFSDDKSMSCPYCNSLMCADWVDVGVGEVQCGPYHCCNCGASEIGPEYGDWQYKDRDGNTIRLKGKRRYNYYYQKKIQWNEKDILKPGHPFTLDEIQTGFYKGSISPYANTVNGVLVDHVTAKTAYDMGILDIKNDLN